MTCKVIVQKGTSRGTYHVMCRCLAWEQLSGYPLSDLRIVRVGDRVGDKVSSRFPADWKRKISSLVSGGAPGSIKRQRKRMRWTIKGCLILISYFRLVSIKFSKSENFTLTNLPILITGISPNRISRQTSGLLISKYFATSVARSNWLGEYDIRLFCGSGLGCFC